MDRVLSGRTFVKPPKIQTEDYYLGPRDYGERSGEGGMGDVLDASSVLVKLGKEESEGNESSSSSVSFSSGPGYSSITPMSMSSHRGENAPPMSPSPSSPRKTRAHEIRRTISRRQLEERFDRPLQDVAKEFGICITLLKKICRAHNIPKWPHRQIRSVNTTIALLEKEVETGILPCERERLEAKISFLKSLRSSIIRNPNGRHGSLKRNALMGRSEGKSPRASNHSSLSPVSSLPFIASQRSGLELSSHLQGYHHQPQASPTASTPRLPSVAYATGGVVPSLSSSCSFPEYEVAPFPRSISPQAYSAAEAAGRSFFSGRELLYSPRVGQDPAVSLPPFKSPSPPTSFSSLPTHTACMEPSVISSSSQSAVAAPFSSPAPSLYRQRLEHFKRQAQMQEIDVWRLSGQSGAGSPKGSPLPVLPSLKDTLNNGGRASFRSGSSLCSILCQ